MANARGFTVIELLVSVAVFAIILTAMTVALMQQQRSFNITKEFVEMDQVGRTALDFIASEIRNAGSRQGKTLAIIFTNGGSQAGGGCAAENTNQAGTEDSPPDCITVFTWDIARGQQGQVLPSEVGVVEVVQAGPPLVLRLPDAWFPAGGEPLVAPGDLLGFRSRINLCSVNPAVSCAATPSLCTECAVIMRVGEVDETARLATFDGAGSVVAQNFSASPPEDFASFIMGSFVPSIAQQSSEMTIVRAMTFGIDTEDGTFQVDQNLSGAPLRFAGGEDAPAIVDMQFVFNLRDADGGLTKVGVPTDASRAMFSDFGAHQSLLGRESDIRSVEIYLLVRSRLRPQLMTGSPPGETSVPQLGDRLSRRTSHSSLDVGYVYRVYSTSVYVRNLSREEFG